MRVIPQKKRRLKGGARIEHALREPEVLEDYLAYPQYVGHFFKRLSPVTRAKLEAISIPGKYLRGQTLFSEGQVASGVFMVAQGRVRLSVDSPDGKSLILHVAVPGELVGLPAAISGVTYENTAVAMEAVNVNFVPTESFCEWVRSHGGIGLKVARILSNIYFDAYRELRYLGLAASAEAKLARFLLEHRDLHNGAPNATAAMTHQEIAGLVGMSRETVTRLLADFRRQGLIKVQDSRMLITNASGLRKLFE